MNKNKFKLLWSILCQEVSIDSHTNNVSLFKVIEQLNFDVKINEDNNVNYDPTKPLFFPLSSTLVILWQNLSDEQALKFPVKICLKDPDGMVLNENLQNIEFEPGKERMRNVINIDGMPITKSGIYIYSIMTKQKEEKEFTEVSSYPIRVHINIKH